MRLLGRTGQVTGRTVAVNGPLKIGRAPDNDLQLSVEGVSRQHASITPDGDAFWLQDLNSANGTFLNGVRIGRERLSHLDIITLGRLVDLIVDARAVAPAAVSATTAEAFLETLDGADDGLRIAIPGGELTIGRVPPSNILVDSRVVSKLHARLRRTPDRLALDDLDSPNGTFVNGTRVTTNHTLNDGDTISIAGVRSFRVHLSGHMPPVVHAVQLPTTPRTAPLAAPSPSFSQEWKTRLVWSPEELAAVEAERARVVEEVRRSTGGLPGESAPRLPTVPAPVAAPSVPAAVQPAARATEYIGRSTLPTPPDLPPVTPSAPAAAQPAARGTEFIGRGTLPTPPDLPPVAAAAAAPPARVPTPTPAGGATSAYRPGADAPPVFAEVGPAAPPAPPRAATPAPPPAPSSAASPPPPDQPVPATSFFRAGADLPPVFGEAPPPASEAPTMARAPVSLPTPEVLVLRGVAGDFVLGEGTHIVGRQEGVSILISDRQVSRNHAAITVQKGRATIEDRASANGTFVNGARLTTPRLLQVGDQVKFGDLVFVVAVKK